MIRLDAGIHEIPFPAVDSRREDFCAKWDLDAHDKEVEGRWKNKKCVVLALRCHNWHGGDIFVTADGAFRQKAKNPAIRDLGFGEILKPDNAVTRLPSGNMAAWPGHPNTDSPCATYAYFPRAAMGQTVSRRSPRTP